MDEPTIQAYDALSGDYATETATFWDRFPKDVITAFLKAATAGDVLDLGSGCGRDAAIFREAGLRTTCLDASRSMINRCAELGFASVQADFLSLPFRDAAFDAAWAYTSLVHTRKRTIHTSLEDVRRVLRRGAALGLGMIEGDGEGYEHVAGINERRWFSYYGADEFKGLLADHDLEITYHGRIRVGRRVYLNFITRRL